MNQEKIGKLIAALRKELNLTQSELGAKVGVGDRAVSKWERGITCPDISIINELSTILGITSDELLKGELNKEHKDVLSKHKLNKKLLFIIPLLLLIIALVIVLINRNRSYVYTLSSKNSIYEVEGNTYFEKGNIVIAINWLSFKNKEYDNLYINNYEYAIMCNKHFIVRKGYVNNSDLNFRPILLKDYMHNFSINYQIDSQPDINKTMLVNNGLVLEIKFLDTDNNIHKEIIEIELKK